MMNLKQFGIFEKDFTKSQWSEITIGNQQGLYVPTFANKDLSPGQMKIIRRGMSKNYDVSCYNSAKFDEFQMYEIFEGLDNGIDVSIYAKPEIDADRMEEIRYGLMYKMNPTPILSYIGNSDYNDRQIKEIVKGVKKNLDVNTYDKPFFNHKQMKQIRKGLEEGLDTSKYAFVDLDEHQMKQIRKGLKQGLNASEYAEPEISAEEMKSLRKSLMVGEDIDNELFDEVLINNIPLLDMGDSPIKSDDVPIGLTKYSTRLSDDDDTVHATLEPKVVVNRGIDVLSNRELEFKDSKDKYIEIEDGIKMSGFRYTIKGFKMKK